MESRSPPTAAPAGRNAQQHLSPSFSDRGAEITFERKNTNCERSLTENQMCCQVGGTGIAEKFALHREREKHDQCTMMYTAEAKPQETHDFAVVRKSVSVQFCTLSDLNYFF